MMQDITELRNRLIERGSNLLYVKGAWDKVIPSVARVLGVTDVFTNRITDHPAVMNGAKLSIATSKVEGILHSHSIAFNESDLDDTGSSFRHIKLVQRDVSGDLHATHQSGISRCPDNIDPSRMDETGSLESGAHQNRHFGKPISRRGDHLSLIHI